MKVYKAFERIYRYYISKSSSNEKIKYFRRQGMKIGQDCSFNTMDIVSEPYLIEIGDHVGIAAGTTFITHDGGIGCFRNEFPDDDIYGKIVIGNNVNIGMNCTILPNTTIGNNCIVGAGSVVRGRYPDNKVIVGNPASILMDISVQKLLYRQNPGRIKTLNMSDREKKPIVIKHFNPPKQNFT